ncbi:MAG: ATP-binding protein [Bacteroidaceae bacterium]|nr:ATP-binding protein [Bacteroidaceae bacterium]
MDSLVRVYKKLLRETTTEFHRYLYDQINWDNRIVGIRGPRGVGKTTMMLQHIKENLPVDDVLYVNADDIYFSNNRLIDLAERLVQHGVHHLYIDEIHKYKDWSKELKLIYDYYSELQVVFSGSSVLDINKGAADLSRRAVMYYLQGLSFREYLQLFKGITVPKYSLDDIVAGVPESLTIETPLKWFGEYLKQGYYPFAKEEGFDEKLRQIINQTLESDIPVFADMSAAMGRKFKQLLMIISQSVPFKPNMSKLADAVGIGRNLMPDYLLYIEEAGMIAQLRDDTGGVRGLGKVDKVYLDNTNLVYSLAENNADIGNLRETFFFNQMRVNNSITTSSVGDFKIRERVFEVGGRSKGKRQIQGAAQGFVVKDGIEFSSGNILPLWWFGLNY